MDSTVLDIGLRNHQISSVQCFFKIQTQTFNSIQSQLHESLSAGERTERNDCLYNDWKQVLTKLINVISVNITDGNSKQFAVCLARIGIQTCNQLLTIVSKSESNRQFSENFSQLFIQSIRFIRHSLRITESSVELNSKKTKDFESIANIEWDFNSTERQVFSDCLHSKCIVLGQYWIKKYKNLDKSWEQIIKIVVLFANNCLKTNNFEDLKTFLSQIGLPFHEIIQNIFQFTSDYRIRQIISSEFSKDVILLNNSIENMDTIVNIIDNLDIESNISLPICWISEMTSESIQRSFYLSFCQNINDFDYKCLSKDIVWKYLLDRNETELLNVWIKTLSNTETNSFPFDWSPTPDMIESISERASTSNKDSLLNSLSIRGLFCSNEFNDFQSILYRLGRIDSNLLTNTSNGFINESKLLSKSFNLKIFLENLMNFCFEHNLNDFLFIYFQNFPQIPINCFNLLTNLLKSSISCATKPSNEQILENILLTAQYVYDIPSPVTIEALIEKADPFVGLIASTYSSMSLYNICSQKSNSINNNSNPVSEQLIAHSFKTQFPIVFNSYIDSSKGKADNELIDETPTIYSLLKDSIPFDVTKMFCWQSMNKLFEQNDDNITSMVFNQLPHFSDTKLADLYGLKANLTFNYYLNNGRVLSAYHQFIHNRKPLTSKSIEQATRRAALVAYNDTTDLNIAVACILFQQLLCDDSTQTLLHLSVANIVMSFASEFLSLNVRQHQTELSNLLKRSHYFGDRRAAAKLLQLTVTAINRKYINYRNIPIEECFDWKIALRFADFHKLEPPLDLLTKCAASDNWLVFTICCQLHQYPKELVLSALKHFNNECIADHLQKAFQSSHTILANNESADNSKILSRKEGQKRTTNKNLRNVLYSRIGLNRPIDVSDTSNRYPKNSFKTSFSPTSECDDQSIASETDYNGIETISVVSSSNASDGEDIPKLSPDNCPTDLFQIILHFQTDSTCDPRKPLMYSSIPLSNPILCLISYSADYDSEKCNILSAFSNWLLSSIEFDIRKQFCEKVDNFDAFNWSPETNYRLIDTVMRDTKNYTIFLKGLKLFNINIKALNYLLSFLIEFFCEKNYYSVQNLKSFQDYLWKYEEPIHWENVFQTKEWIQKASVIVLTNALKNAKNHELVILLRHYEFARIQGSFSPEIKVHDFRKLYNLCQCLSDTDIVLPISDLLTDEIEFKSSNNNYFSIIKNIISSLQKSGHYSEARSLANKAEMESNDLIINEWTLRANDNLDSFKFWVKCWDSLTAVDSSMLSAFKVFHKFLSQIPSLVVKCFLVFKCLIASQNFDNQRERSGLETIFWKCIVQIESNRHELSATEADVWTQIWCDIIGFIKSNKNRKNKLTFDSMDLNLPIEKLHKTLDIVIEKLLNNSCIETAHEVSLMFDYSHQDLDIILACDNLAKGLIKSLSEAPLSVQLKTKAKEQLKKNDLCLGLSQYNSISNLHCMCRVLICTGFSDQQKELIGFIESISSLSTIGWKACQRVVLYFKISCVLHRNYTDIKCSESDDLELLKSLISLHSTMANDALSFAKELIVLNEISDENIASIICRETLNNLKNSSPESETSRDSSFSNFIEMSPNFLSLVRLLNDTTILGTKLITESEYLLNDSNNNFLLTKLYIKAHECFSLACDVKGIALVLRKARLFITQNLLQLRDFNSILRLMTGIGRYSEMTYCFDLFKENNEFELLLSKRIEKAPQLRIALLDYLKGDKEVFPLVALRFCLYREIAENHEMSAKQQFNELKYKLSTNVMSSHRQQLETIIDEFIDAHESYSKAGCYSHSDSCAKMARLIALQIHYLPNNINIINMNSSQIAPFIEHNSNFQEALIIVEAYQYNTSWVSAVFNHVFINNDWNYWSDYISRRDISTSFVEELVHKYIQFVSNKNLSNDRLIQMKKSIQRLIEYIDDYELRFRLALKLNLLEVNHKMLSEESGAYLQDLRRNGIL